MSSPRTELHRRSLLLVTGKGGVGKTTVSAALAVALEGRGRRVLLLESDPRESAHELLGVAPSGGELVEVSRRLALLDLPPRRAADRVLERRVALPGVVRRLREKELYRHFVDGCPGLGEMSLLETARLAISGDLEGGRVDVVVIDAPASGHGLSLLRAPRLVRDAVGDGPIAQAAGELAGWVEDADRAGVVLVTLAEEMPVTESLELRAALLDRVGLGVELLVVNGLLPEIGDRRALAGWRSEPAVDLWMSRRRAQEEQLERLAQTWRGPRVDLPLSQARGGELARELARRLTNGPRGAREEST